MNKLQSIVIASIILVGFVLTEAPQTITESNKIGLDTTYFEITEKVPVADEITEEDFVKKIVEETIPETSDALSLRNPNFPNLTVPVGLEKLNISFSLWNSQPQNPSSTLVLQKLSNNALENLTVVERKSLEEHINMIHKNLIGGWIQCTTFQIQDLERLIASLSVGGFTNDVYVSLENVVECEQQLTSVVVFNLLLSINKVRCQISYTKEEEGVLRLVEDGSLPFENIPHCGKIYAVGK